MTKLTKREDFGFKCEILIADFNYWQNRAIYIELIESFLNNIIDIKEFEKKFLFLWNDSIDEEKSWENFLYIIKTFKLDQFQGFSSLISELFLALESFQPDPLLRQDYEINENELKVSLKEN